MSILIHRFKFEWRGIFQVLLLVILLHYFLNPSESEDIASANIVRIIFGFFISLLVISRLKISASILTVMSFITVILLCLALRNIFENPRLLFTPVLYIVSSALIALALKDLGLKGIFFRAFDYLLLIWVFAFIFQICIYVIEGEVFDLHNVFHPLSEGRTLEVLNVIRFSGVHIEPGTYANWVYGLVLLRTAGSKSLFDNLSIFAMLSIFATFSSWGIIVSCIYILCLVLHLLFQAPNDGRRTFKSLAYLLILIGGILIFIAQVLGGLENVFAYLELRSTLQDQSAVAKASAYDHFIALYDELLIFGKPIGFDFCNGCESPQDAGIFINLIVKFGALFSIVLFYIISKKYYMNYGLLGLILIAPLLFTKFFYFEPIFWIISIYSFSCVIQAKENVNESRLLKQVF